MRLIWRLYSFRHSRECVEHRGNEVVFFGQALRKKQAWKSGRNAPGESWTTDMIILDDITAKAKETKQIIGFDEGLI